MLRCSTFLVLGPFRSDEAFGGEFTKSDGVIQRHLLDDFGEFVTERFVLWSWVQKVSGTVFEELSNGVQHHVKRIKLIKSFKFYEIALICVQGSTHSSFICGRIFARIELRSKDFR